MESLRTLLNVGTPTINHVRYNLAPTLRSILQLNGKLFTLFSNQLFIRWYFSHTKQFEVFLPSSKFVLIILDLYTMKTTQSILSQFEKTAGIWLASLSQYSEEQFAKKSGADSWSIGQVYNHLIVSTRLYHLQQIAQCLEGKQTERNAKKNFLGKLTYFIGSIPPMRIKVSSSISYTPKQPPNIESMKINFEKLINIMRETEQNLSGASEIPKTANHVFGFLNAQEWFQMIEMHFRHHLRQKKRLDRFLAQ